LQTVEFALPALATVALGAALLAPLRDTRRGKRVRFGNRSEAPFKTDFGALERSADAPRAALRARTIVAVLAERVAALRALECRSPGKLRTLFGALRLRYTREQYALPGIDVIRDTLVPANASFAEQLALKMPSAPAMHPGSPGQTSCGERSVAQNEPVLAPPIPSMPPAPPRPELPEPLVLRSQRSGFERIVPLTRLPLRTHAAGISGCSLADTSGGAATRAERHARLTALARAGGESQANVLALAYREEDTEGRLLAMRALMSVDRASAFPIFADALRTGTDEERALAIDALAASGARDALVPAFSDRALAVAAKAALAYVGTNVRDDYERALTPFLDRTRIDALIALLEGYLES
jgi:hypothetical protein